MKRFLLVLVLAVAVLALLTAPAFAGKPVPTVRPPADVPILWAFGGGWWYEYTAGQTPSEVPAWQAFDPPPSSDPENEPYWRAVPKETTVYTSLGWVGVNYGAVMNAAKQNPVTIDITGLTDPDFSRHLSPAQVRPYWTGPYLLDQWWDEWTGYQGWTAFNPKIGAPVYLNELYMPLGSFAAGWYHCFLSMPQVKPINDLMFIGAFRPAHYPAGTWSVSSEFDFYVG